MEKRVISGSTRVGGLIGRGITHSLSPRIHNTAAAILGLDVVYVPFDFAMAPDVDFFRNMLSAPCYGFNVTVPYKESIAALFASSSLTSCNTLIAKAGHWETASTDADGFFAGLREIGKELTDFESVICLGHGGAAKALIASIQASCPALPIHILKRSGLDDKEGGFLNFAPFEPEALAALIHRHPRSLLIQCTSAPLRGDRLERFSLKGLSGAFVDLVYGSPSALLAEAQGLAIPCQDGIPMLIHQALRSQQLWWGQAATFSDMKAAIERP